MLLGLGEPPGRRDGGAVLPPPSPSTPGRTGARSCLSYRGTDSTLVGWKEDWLQHELPDAGRPARGRRRSTCPTPCGGGAAPCVWAGTPKVGIVGLRGGGLPVRPTACWRSTTTTAPASAPGPWMRRAMRRCGGGYTPLYPSPRWWGMLLDHEEDYTVVRSVSSPACSSTAPFPGRYWGRTLWRWSGSPDASRFVSRTLKEWVASLTPERREQFVDLLFEVLGGLGGPDYGGAVRGRAPGRGGWPAPPPGAGRRRPPSRRSRPWPVWPRRRGTAWACSGRGDIREHGGRY